jgi:ribonuclease P protein component
MLIVLPNELGKVRIAISANRKIGGAVQRNRAKRVLRSGMRPLLDQIKPGNDLVLIAKPEIRPATALDTETALAKMLKQAALIERN